MWSLLNLTFGSMWTHLNWAYGSVWSHLRFQTQSALTRFALSEFSNVPLALCKKSNNNKTISDIMALFGRVLNLDIGTFSSAMNSGGLVFDVPFTIH